jgi:hypothetical protein
VFGLLDFGVPRWIIHDKEYTFSCTRWILGIFSANSLDFYYFLLSTCCFLDPALGYHMYGIILFFEVLKSNNDGKDGTNRFVYNTQHLDISIHRYVHL